MTLIKLLALLNSIKAMNDDFTNVELSISTAMKGSGTLTLFGVEKNGHHFCQEHDFCGIDQLIATIDEILGL
jgi:hypothetical protein